MNVIVDVKINSSAGRMCATVPTASACINLTSWESVSGLHPLVEVMYVVDNKKFVFL